MNTNHDTFRMKQYFTKAMHNATKLVELIY